jgi:hypothetical protein
MNYPDEAAGQKPKPDGFSVVYLTAVRAIAQMAPHIKTN